jgi:glutamine amidotransferase
MISVVNYHGGNAPSVGYALGHLGIPCALVSTAAEIARATRLILPGVGAARATMDSLRESGLVAALEERVLGAGVPFLGICVGHQILFEHSEEGDVACLGWFKGRVRRFPDSAGPVPQIGWNEVRFQRPHPMVAGLPGGAYVYFVNSYYVVPDDPAVTVGVTEYGGVPFCAMLARDNIVGTQFHVEKSGPVGLGMLARFAIG